MRRIKPNAFKRIVEGWKVGLSTIFIITGILTSIFTLILDDKINTIIIIVLVVILIASGIFAAFIRGKQKLVPDIIVDELSTENQYFANTCTRESMYEADEMTKPYFGRNFIPCDKIEQWRIKNNKGFVHLTNADGLLCACFVIIGLESSFFDQFIAGRLAEHQIDSDVVLPYEEMRKQNRIYISGVVVREPGSYIGAKRARVTLWTMLEYAKNVFTLRKTRTFYAVGITTESEKLLKAMGFGICGNKESRKDESNLYKLDLDKNTWLKLISKVGDYSRMVDINYNIFRT